MDEKLTNTEDLTNTQDLNNAENLNNTQDLNNNGVPDWFESRVDDQSSFPEGDLGHAYTSEDKIAAKIPNYKEYKWYQNPAMDGPPGTEYFYTLGEKVENKIESGEITPDELPKGSDIQKEAKQLYDDNPHNDEVNNEVVDKALESPKLASFLDDIKPTNLSGDEIIEDFDFKDPFERMNKKELREKAKRIEKDIPIPRLTKKDLNNKIIDIANEGVGEDELSKIQKAYAEAKKPTKYEKEAAKAAGLIDNESEYEKMSKKEKKKVEKLIDEMLEEQKKAGDERRAKEATKERVNKFFKPLQYERKVYANGRNRVLPKGTFMSPDGTEYYNPETETIEQVIEEPEKKEEPGKKKKKDWLKLFGTAKGEPIDTKVSSENANNKPINEPIKSGVTPGSFIPNFTSGSGVSAPSISTNNRESKTNDNATSSIKIDNREQDNNAGSINGTTASNKHLDDTFGNLKFDEAKEKDIKSDGQTLVSGDVIHHTSNNAGVDISGLARNNAGNNAGIDIKDLIKNSAGKNTLPFKFFFDGDDIIVAEIGTGRKLPLEEFIKVEPNSANRIIEVLNELI